MLLGPKGVGKSVCKLGRSPEFGLTLADVPDVPSVRERCQVGLPISTILSSLHEVYHMIKRLQVPTWTCVVQRGRGLGRGLGGHVYKNDVWPSGSILGF